MKEIRILIADNSEFLRRTVRSLLVGHPNWAVVDETAGEAELLGRANESKPDVIIMDVSARAAASLDAAEKILTCERNTRIIFVTAQAEEEHIRTALQAGVYGYILKSEFAVEIVRAIHTVAKGRHFLDSRVSEIVMKGYLDRAAGVNVKQSPSSLTPREREICRLLALGNGNKQVARALRIRVRTVETHRRNIMRKLNVHTLAEVIHYAIRKEMILIHPEICDPVGPGSNNSVMA
jgi:two-component system, NarL family, response regulator NreC